MCPPGRFAFPFRYADAQAALQPTRVSSFDHADLPAQKPLALIQALPEESQSRVPGEFLPQIVRTPEADSRDESGVNRSTAVQLLFSARRVGNDLGYALLQRSRRPPVFEDERIRFVLLKHLNVIYGVRTGDHGDTHLPADDSRDLNDLRPFETGDVEMLVSGNGFVRQGKFVQERTAV